MEILEKVEVEYKTFAGWNTSISQCRDLASLPENAKIYVKFIEEFLNVPGKAYFLNFVLILSAHHNLKNRFNFNK